jgi:hypothetical protein
MQDSLTCTPAEHRTWIDDLKATVLKPSTSYGMGSLSFWTWTPTSTSWTASTTRTVAGHHAQTTQEQTHTRTKGMGRRFLFPHRPGRTRRGGCHHR